jgi:hypothetical protein
MRVEAGAATRTSARREAGLGGGDLDGVGADSAAGVEDDVVGLAPDVADA